MEILINGESLDFSLENEQNLGEIVAGLENWLSGSRLILTAVQYNSENLLSKQDESWRHLPLNEVNTLDVTVKHESELLLANLQTVLDYLSMLKQALEARNKQLLGELISGFQYLTESIEKHFESKLHGDLIQLTALLGGQSAEAILDWPMETAEEVLQLIAKLESAVSFRLQESRDPKEALKGLVEALSASIAEISEVSILLQTGHDRQAMESIIRFSELAQSLIRIMSSLRGTYPESEKSLSISGQDYRRFYSELNGVLKELLEAFKRKDSVLIGDLLEYEIAPRLEALKNFMLELP